jgi:Tol biopolymer transport system component
MPTGTPKRIMQWPGSDTWGFAVSADGKRLVFQKTAGQTQIHVGELDGGGTRMKTPRRLTNAEANDVPTAWTPDSKALLFQSDRNNGTSGIFKQQINSDEAQAVIIGQQDAYDPRISAGGEWILYFETPKGAGPSTPVRLMRVPIAGGPPQFVLEMGDADFDCSCAPAGLCVLAENSHDGKQLTVTAFDPLKGRGKVLRTIPKDAAASFAGGISPDGTVFAIAKYSEPEIHIRLLSLSGSTDREITVKGWPNVTGLNWSADGKGMYCGSVSVRGTTLLHVDLEGNARVLWQSSGHRIAGIPSLDGRYLAIISPKISAWSRRNLGASDW